VAVHCSPRCSAHRLLAQGRSERSIGPTLWSAAAVFAPLAILVALYYRIAGFDGPSRSPAHGHVTTMHARLCSLRVMVSASAARRGTAAGGEDRHPRGRGAAAGRDQSSRLPIALSWRGDPGSRHAVAPAWRRTDDRSNPAMR